MQKSVELFTAIPRCHNCAQSVAAGAGREDLLPELADKGGGRAPDGVCGALFAAQSMVPEGQREGLREAFAAELGSFRCRELKANGVPCVRCVELASELLAKSK